MGKGRKPGGVPARRGVKEETAAAIKRRPAGGLHGAARRDQRREKSAPVGRVAEADPLPRSRSSPPRSGLVLWGRKRITDWMDTGGTSIAWDDLLTRARGPWPWEPRQDAPRRLGPLPRCSRPAGHGNVHITPWSPSSCGSLWQPPGRRIPRRRFSTSTSRRSRAARWS
jgi:hypothetical protein